MTFHEWCTWADVTPAERRELRRYLITMRIMRVVQLLEEDPDDE